MFDVRTLAVALIMALGLLVAACGGPPATTAPSGGTTRAINVDGTEFKFAPADQTFKAGEKIKVTLTNKGNVVHTWVLLGSDGKTELVKLKADPGKTDSKEFNAPAAGTYQIVCDEAGHKESGMVGKATVQ